MPQDSGLRSVPKQDDRCCREQAATGKLNLDLAFEGVGTALLEEPGRDNGRVTDPAPTAIGGPE